MGGALSGCLFARHALLPQGWRRDVLLEWDAAGDLTRIQEDAVPAPGVEVAQYVLPGMVNLHSHAFQRALGGMTEVAGDGPDSFWTWRDLMYRFARHITPEQMEAIAAQLFAECLRHGYTAVCEFHYLQRDAAGALYARPAETAERVLAAARLSGIGMTMLPVLYSHAGFGAQPLKAEQARFRTGADDVLRIVEALAPQRGGQVEVGFAPHSLRAADVAQIRAVAHALPAGRPIHIHIAEQQGEVRQCLDASGRRPVQYLYDQVDVDARWCLVHATHVQPDEVALMAASGAVAGLCPTWRRTWAMACSRWPNSSPPAGVSASAATATYRSRLSRNCAGLNMASVCSASSAMWPPRLTSAMWATTCGRRPCAAARRRPDASSVPWRQAAAPTCWCSTRRM